MIALYLSLIPFVILLPLIGKWIIFQKANREGWETLIPLHSTVTTIEIAGKPGWWIFLYLVPILNIVLYVMVTHGLSKRFGHGVGFTLGLLFFPFVFLLILAFGGSTYQGEAAPVAPAPAAPQEEDEDEVDEVTAAIPSSLRGSLKPRPVAKAAAEATTIPESKPKAALKPRPTLKPKTVNEAMADNNDRVIDVLQKSAAAEDLTTPIAGAPLSGTPTRSPLFNGASELEEQEKKSKSKMIIILISAVALLLLVIIGVGAYLLLNKSDKAEGLTIEQVENDPTLYVDPTSDPTPVETPVEIPVETPVEVIEDEPEEAPVGMVAIPSDLPTNSIKFENGYYSGDIQDGKANGMGKMTYTKRTLISKFDLDKRYAEAGQYIIGNWYNNEIDFGKLYNSDGVIIETIIIGRAQ